MASLSCHRPCVVSAFVGRSHEKWSPSKAAASWPLVLVSPPTWHLRTIEQPPLLRLWPAPQSPVHRPSRGSIVCICGRSRNGRADCAPVVHYLEQSLKECNTPDALKQSL